jgi:hypothetical protein
MGRLFVMPALFTTTSASPKNRSASLVGVIQGSHDVPGFRVMKRVTISGGWVTAVVGRASNSSSAPVSPGARIMSDKSRTAAPAQRGRRENDLRAHG